MHKKLRLALLVAAIFSGATYAQAASLDIPAQSLAGALDSLAKQSHIHLQYDQNQLKGIQAPSLRGDLTPEDALRKLLDGSAFVFSKTGPENYAVQKQSPDQSNKVWPEVAVISTAENGYKADKATVASKGPLTLREIPESVSVITRQQMDDQGMVTMTDAMTQATGVNVITNDTLNNQYYARGYGLGVMYDGVPSYNGLNPSNNFDLAIYDRIEVLRGPDSLLRGVGDLGGIVNLVKKQPQDTFGISWETTAGSWDTYRAAGDITGPLNEDKTLRGRLVLSDEDRGYFYDHTHSHSWLGLAALEYDPSAQTKISLSFSDQDQHVQAPWSGLPAYTNLTDPNNGVYPLLNVSQSTFEVPDWGQEYYRTKEISAGVEHRFDNSWMVKASLNHREQEQYYDYPYTYSSINPITDELSYRSMRGDYNYARDGFDVYSNGPIDLFGRKHNLTVGLNTEEYDSSGTSGSGPVINNVVFGDASQIPDTAIKYTSGSETWIKQYGLYSQINLSITDPLTVVLGGRTTTFKSESRSISPSAQTPWVEGANASNHFTPYGGVIYKLTQEVSLYGSYTDIFVPQTQQRADGSTLDPRTGYQYEVGSKGEFFDGKLGASIALFDMRDKNRAYPDPAYPDANFYIEVGEVESKGVELEATGKPLRGLDLTAGYTYLETTYVENATFQGQAYSIQTPRNQFKFWGNYHFENDTPLAGFSAGLGLLANSNVQSTRGWRDQLLDSGYAVVNANVSYQFDKIYSASLRIDNLLDQKYYASVGTPNIYNFYGAPRNFMLTLRARY
ncbi:MAG: TonB-dependent siderophore receptor [Burkholderiaceae bacterium]|nr:TonB-dependent siderophore receptor [Burkholderiaceae bacterium]